MLSRDFNDRGSFLVMMMIKLPDTVRATISSGGGSYVDQQKS